MLRLKLKVGQFLSVGDALLRVAAISLGADRLHQVTLRVTAPRQMSIFRFSAEGMLITRTSRVASTVPLRFGRTIVTLACGHAFTLGPDGVRKDVYECPACIGRAQGFQDQIRDAAKDGG